jgi:hypothetical protein
VTGHTRLRPALVPPDRAGVATNSYPSRVRNARPLRPAGTPGRSRDPGSRRTGWPARRARRPRPGGTSRSSWPSWRTKSFWCVAHCDRDRVHYLQRKRSPRVTGLLQRPAGWAQMSARSNRYRIMRAQITSHRSEARKFKRSGSLILRRCFRRCVRAQRINSRAWRISSASDRRRAIASAL